MKKSDKRLWKMKKKTEANRKAKEFLANYKRVYSVDKYLFNKRG